MEIGEQVMGKMKAIAIAKIDAADALWAKTEHHNSQFYNYMQAVKMYGDAIKVQHVIDYHNREAFEAECAWIDATGHYDHVIGDMDEQQRIIEDRTQFDIEYALIKDQSVS
jgi:hypothetical protein